MSKIDELPLTADQRRALDEDLANGLVPHTAISRKVESWGFTWSEASVRRYRSNMGVVLEQSDDSEEADWETASVVVDADGADLSTGALTKPLDLSKDWDAVLRDFGLDPEIFYVVDDTVRMSKWQQSKRLDNGDRDVVWLYSYRARFARRKAGAELLDLDALTERVRNWKPKKYTATSDDLPSTFVVTWADWQIGKSAGGGVERTIERIHESIELSVARISELRKIGRNIEKIVVANMGDPSEGCDGQYESQLFSVELTQRAQLNLIMDEWTNGIMALEPDMFLSVLCNHGEWTRRGPGTRPVTTDSDNVGGYLADTLQRIFEGRDGGPSEWVIPHDEMVQMVNLSGLDVAFTHGHKIPSESREVDWLRGQSIRLLRDYGREPRLWVTAHRHHVRVDDFGPWWRLQCPSLDGGSKYFTDTTSKWATPGTLTFLAGQHDPRGFSDLAVLGSIS